MGYREKYSPRGYECQYHPAKDKDFPLCEMFQQLIKASLVCTHTHTHTHTRWHSEELDSKSFQRDIVM